ncbi:hypothetical protein [Hymenobacter arizonensis]|uniref:Uncharacterized protein n=1 Tax=Hymenobacter arizonensis TaxID=1227077 RepID=A0A1I6BDY6_HYMAR|nr:hypothetical protein [Hymenobacter arizonensis]SFQ79172.1 hypothetical protein SAMN04515668_4410 [Hymenobacter arizonensis]
MITLVKNQYYELAYSAAKNRIYCTLIGYWRSADLVPTYVADWEKAVRLTQRGFTVLADNREMKTHPATVKALHAQVADTLPRAGMSYLAEVVAIDKIAVLQVSGITQQAGVGHIRVESLPLGEQILDQLMPR